MYSIVATGGGFILLVWLILLSIGFWREIRFLRKLKPKPGQDEDLRAKLGEVIDRLDEINRREKVSFGALRELASDNMRAVQKFALHRYNPYGDVGGDQSFSLALLDGRSSGFVISSLHTRSGTRVYAKVIEKGKSEISLSQEEREVLKQAEENS